MQVPIESKCFAYIDADKADKIPELIKDVPTVDWEKQDDFGMPLLLRLIETGSVKAIQAILPLLTKDQIEKIRDENQCTALHFAVLSSNTDAVKAVAASSPSLLLEKDSQGCLPIHWAARHGHHAMMGDLLPTGVSPSTVLNAPDTTDILWTPIHYAVSGNKLETCQWLVQNGADKDHKDAHGRTALDMAKERSYLDLVSFLSS